MVVEFDIAIDQFVIDILVFGKHIVQCSGYILYRGKGHQTVHIYSYLDLRYLFKFELDLFEVDPKKVYTYRANVVDFLMVVSSADISELTEMLSLFAFLSAKLGSAKTLTAILAPVAFQTWQCDI